MAESEQSDGAFAHVIHERALRAPGAVAITHDRSRLTYEALAHRCAAAAARLADEWGVRQGDRVAWLGLHDPAQLVLLFALARLGAILLPLNFRLAPREWDTQLAQCTPRLIVHDPTWAAAAHELAQRNAIEALSSSALDAGGSPGRLALREAAPAPPLLL